MKIGISTFSTTLDNYGQVLQYLATQEYLKSLGHDPYLIVIKQFKLKVEIKKLLKKIFYTIFPNKISEREYKYRIILENSKLNEIKHPRNFEQFREKYFKRVYGNYNKLRKFGFDAYAAGSDQIWSSHSEHMLGWTPENAYRFSLAPSIGEVTLSSDIMKNIKRDLQRFDFITVRENTGIKLCESCGIYNATQIFDPTLLLTKKEYKCFADYSLTASERPYVLVYLLSNPIEIELSQIIKFIKSHGYDIKYVEGQGRDDNYEDKLYPTVQQWLGLMELASYVITNSYHGSIFSIINRHPFITLSLTGSWSYMNNRLIDLYEPLGLMDRINVDSLENMFNEINWNHVEEAISANRKKVSILMKQIGKTDL